MISPGQVPHDSMDRWQFQEVFLYRYLTQSAVSMERFFDRHVKSDCVGKPTNPALVVWALKGDNLAKLETKARCPICCPMIADL